MNTENESLDSTPQSRNLKSKPSQNNVEDVQNKEPVLVEGFALEPVDDCDLLIGTLELDLTNNLEQAILDITGALLNGYTLKLYPVENKDRYSLEVEAGVIHFNQ